jgi:hypothetical protein
MRRPTPPSRKAPWIRRDFFAHGDHEVSPASAAGVAHDDHRHDVEDRDHGRDGHAGHLDKFLSLRMRPERIEDHGQADEGGVAVKAGVDEGFAAGKRQLQETGRSRSQQRDGQRGDGHHGKYTPGIRQRKTGLGNVLEQQAGEADPIGELCGDMKKRIVGKRNLNSKTPTSTKTNTGPMR